MHTQLTRLFFAFIGLLFSKLLYTKEELKAAKRIIGMLPTEQAQEFIAIWEEFEEGRTNESKFARAM
ncbi:HD domain-containing protein, partial [Ancylomarina sp.]|uniref:HD domain-containing protein n=1 Tax=Ancylomarina sp. TaxID=1970196 RepID=UPI0035695B47